MRSNSSLPWEVSPNLSFLGAKQFGALGLTTSDSSAPDRIPGAGPCFRWTAIGDQILPVVSHDAHQSTEVAVFALRRPDAGTHVLVANEETS